MTRADLRAALSNANVRAFNAVRDLGEHGPNADDPDRYRTMFGGEKFDAPPWEHPRRKITRNGITSTAAGGPQFLAGTWDEMARKYGFEDFSPGCQEEAAVGLYVRRGALDDIIAGRFEEAIAKCAKEWASLPGSPYGQPTLTMDRARDRYLERGGFLSAADPLASEHYGEAVTESTINPVPSPDAQEANMAPLILPLLQVAAQFLPQIAGLFGSGSEVANRNLAAGKVLAEAITTATNSPNLQAAVEKMAADPEAAKVARAAVAEVMALVEVGGGGIEGARKAAASSEQIPPWKNPAVWFMGAFIPMVYGAAYIVLTGDSFSQDAKMMVITAIFSGLLAAGTGFFLGSSLGSQRKTTMIGKE